jgi:low affinity Fe/Cu permease
MKRKDKTAFFETISSAVTRATGTTAAIVIAFSIILVWAITGPFLEFSNTWQLIINTGTTITTFLMVFLIQRNQNKDSAAVHLKLNELILANALANNRLVAVEDISEEELKVLQKFYQHLAKIAKDELSLEESHSIEEAAAHHERKKYSTRSDKSKSRK